MIDSQARNIKFHTLGLILLTAWPMGISIDLPLVTDVLIKFVSLMASL